MVRSPRPRIAVQRTWGMLSARARKHALSYYCNPQMQVHHNCEHGGKDLQCYTATPNGDTVAEDCQSLRLLFDAASNLITNAVLIDDPRMGGATECYAVTLDDYDALLKALADIKRELSSQINAKNRRD